MSEKRQTWHPGSMREEERRCREGEELVDSPAMSCTGEQAGERRGTLNWGGQKSLVTSESVSFSLFMLPVLSMACLNCNLITLLIFIFGEKSN
jgi:hypothetical protein